MKILSVVGARPQFVKAAVVSRALSRRSEAREYLLHTGQHYDVAMSEVFFRELGVPIPYRNLNVGSGTHGIQTASIVRGVEQECLRLRPELVLIYGDTNSTLAAAMAAAKLGIPIAHVEAGLRSFDREMPEEINRIMADRFSTFLFAPTRAAVENLRREGIHKGVRKVGDVMIDAIHFFRSRALSLKPKGPLEALMKEPFFLLTLHRQENTDREGRLREIFSGLSKSDLPFLFPMHPRTRRKLREFGLRLPVMVRACPPLSYLETLSLQFRSQAVWTDSGGMQKEAVVLGKRCYTLRESTEWVETVESGWNTLVGADRGKIMGELRSRSWEEKLPPFKTALHYGDGHSGERIAAVLSRSNL